MDEDRIKGKMKDIAGRVERKVGEWTKDEDAKVEGAAKEVEGKIENAVGKIKDKASDVTNRTKSDAERAQKDKEPIIDDENAA
jgi:uncharacterized protein YjbJ (UPF0337 family)